MILLPSTQSIATVILERMLYCLAEGSAVVVAVAAVLRLASERNSRTRFAVWLATLMAVVLLPVAQMGVAATTGLSWDARGSSSSHALLTLSAKLAEYMVLAWAAIAGLGLLRIAASLRQVRRLRRDCVPMNRDLLGPELETLIREFSWRRPADILVSSRLEVPTAIGFFRPAVLIPAWMADTADQEELKYVLLHELAHLQRRDDWTNLLQKLAKAVLFFHPGVWWIEQKLSLDREMACDDAVLAQAGSPRLYARCLARVAEKSFLHRQISLAQAAVDRMRQLTLRVTRILSADSPTSTRLWRPALPMVAVIALLCAISTANVPSLISFKETQPLAARSPGRADHVVNDPMRLLSAPSGRPSPTSLLHMAKFTAAGTKPSRAMATRTRNLPPKRDRLLPARYAESRRPDLPSNESPRPAEGQPSSPYDREAATRAPVQDREGPARQYGVVFVMMTSERISTDGVVTWQVNMWEWRWPAPAEHSTKPIPRKT